MVATQEKVSVEKSNGRFFSTYSGKEAGTEGVVGALRKRINMKINGSVLASLSGGKARVSCSEKSRSADDAFWREIVDELETYLATTPSLLARHFNDDRFEADLLFQVQWLTGRKADYWHQDFRWNTLWDAVIFLYLGTHPTPTDLACPATQPSSMTTAEDYVSKPQGQPHIAQQTAAGILTTHRPLVHTGDIVLIDNHITWHRTSPALARGKEEEDINSRSRISTLDHPKSQFDDDALMTIRIKHLSPSK